ncbi:MAG: hypothetical protein ACKOW9_03765, partial [Candidatus Paceibacterota bacterium]
SVKQPVSYSIPAERCVVSSVLKDPSTYFRIRDLSPEMFVDKDMSELWSRIQGYGSELPVIEYQSDEKLILPLISKATDTHEYIKFSAALETLFKEQSFSDTEFSQDTDELLDAGSVVLDSFDDRTLYNGVSEIVSGPDESKPLVRNRRRLSIRRAFFTSTLLSFMSYVSLFTAEYSFNSLTSTMLGALALLALSFFSVVWALVDWDTFYLDFPNFLLGSVTAWLLTSLALYSEGDINSLFIGLGLSLTVAGIFFIANLIFKFIRGVDGMGMGDSYIVVTTAGVPTAVTGSLAVGFWCFIGSMLLGVLGWLFLRILGKVTVSTPYAFGPYLALGWVFSCLFWGM